MVKITSLPDDSIHESIFDKVVESIEAMSVATGVVPTELHVNNSLYITHIRWIEKRLQDEYNIKVVII